MACGVCVYPNTGSYSLDMVRTVSTHNINLWHQTQKGMTSHEYANSLPDFQSSGYKRSHHEPNHYMALIVWFSYQTLLVRRNAITTKTEDLKCTSFRFLLDSRNTKPTEK